MPRHIELRQDPPPGGAARVAACARTLTEPEKTILRCLLEGPERSHNVQAPIVRRLHGGGLVDIRMETDETAKRRRRVPTMHITRAGRAAIGADA